MEPASHSLHSNEAEWVRMEPACHSLHSSEAQGSVVPSTCSQRAEAHCAQHPSAEAEASASVSVAESACMWTRGPVCQMPRPVRSLEGRASLVLLPRFCLILVVPNP